MQLKIQMQQISVGHFRAQTKAQLVAWSSSKTKANKRLRKYSSFCVASDWCAQESVWMDCNISMFWSQSEIFVCVFRFRHFSFSNVGCEHDYIFCAPCVSSSHKTISFSNPYSQKAQKETHIAIEKEKIYERKKHNERNKSNHSWKRTSIHWGLSKNYNPHIFRTDNFFKARTKRMTTTTETHTAKWW